MRSSRCIGAFLALLALLAVGAASAVAAGPTAHELPDATHGVPFGVAADGTVWFTVSHGTEWEGAEGEMIGSLSSDGKFTEIPTPGFEVLTLDPRGSIWGTEANPNSSQTGSVNIVRISPSGQTEATYTVAGGRGEITAMLATPGALWFTRRRRYARCSIERLSTVDGSVRQYFLKLGGEPTSLALAPNGAIWFVESGWSTIGRINPNGRVRHWIPTGREATPRTITIGPDGTAWFGMSTWRITGFADEEIGRINRAGKLAEFQIGDGSSSEIAAGPEGRLWFPSSFGGRYRSGLNSIGPSGKLGKPICADPACGPEPTGLIAAPDGSLVYGLRQLNTNTGGGGSGIGIEMEIENQAGAIARLTP